MRLRSIFLFFLLFQSGVLLSKSAKEQVLDFFEEYSKAEGFYMKYRIVNSFHNNRPSSKHNVEVFCNANCVYSEMDGEYSFTNKKYFISTSVHHKSLTVKPGLQPEKGKHKPFPDSVFNALGKEIRLTDTTSGKINFLLFMHRESMISRIQYTLNSTSKKLERLVFHFNKEVFPMQEKCSIEIEEFEINPKFRKDDFSEEFFFGIRKGKIELKEKFNGYTVYDYRKKNN